MKQATVIIPAGQSNAVGGTSLWRDWLSPSGGDAYDPTACALSPEEPEEEPDVYHYDLGSTVELGRLFAEALLKAWD